MDIRSGPLLVSFSFLYSLSLSYAQDCMADHNCIDNQCSLSGVCTNGCEQWFVPDSTTGGYNCNTAIPEIDCSTQLAIESVESDFIKFTIEMDTQISNVLASYYSYATEHSSTSADDDFETFSSNIEHDTNADHVTHRVDTEVDENQGHWFRLRIDRSQNDITTSGDPCDAVSLYFADNKNIKKQNDHIIPLVILLVIFVTATVILAVLSNYLARKRAEAVKKQFLNQGTFAELPADSISNASMLSTDDELQSTSVPMTPVGLKYHKKQTLDGASNQGYLRSSQSDSDLLRSSSSADVAAPVPMPEVEETSVQENLSHSRSSLCSQSSAHGSRVSMAMDSSADATSTTGLCTQSPSVSTDTSGRSAADSEPTSTHVEIHEGKTANSAQKDPETAQNAPAKQQKLKVKTTTKGKQTPRAKQKGKQSSSSGKKTEKNRTDNKESSTTERVEEEVTTQSVVDPRDDNS